VVNETTQHVKARLVDLTAIALGSGITIRAVSPRGFEGYRSCADIHSLHTLTFVLFIQSLVINQLINMKTVAALSAIIALANAHATWQQLWKNGEDLKSTCARLPPSNSPIEDYTSTALQCSYRVWHLSCISDILKATSTLPQHLENVRLRLVTQSPLRCTNTTIASAQLRELAVLIGDRFLRIWARSRMLPKLMARANSSRSIRTAGRRTRLRLRAMLISGEPRT
jgi:hypothetical protein